MAWVNANVLRGTTAYRRFHAGLTAQKFCLDFDTNGGGARSAPAHLREEMQALLNFKSAVLTEVGFERCGVWSPPTVAQRKKHLALMFGAMAAPADGPAQGLGAPLHSLTLGLLVFPEVWDWYARWRERRRGFYTVWEVDMLMLGTALVRPRTGWLRQTPWLANRLRPIAGLVSPDAVSGARENWNAACDRAFGHTRSRADDVARVKRVHRDTFEPIVPILEADDPVGEYRKIAQEVLRRRPDPACAPVPAAEASRAYLMIRFALHLGLRPKNLRQLLYCPPGGQHRTENRLEALKRGELRWIAKESAWEVLIPSRAFKNSGSSYFSGRPFRARLPDVDGLYHWIKIYTECDRPRLLDGAADTEEFFIATINFRRSNPSFSAAGFYELWQQIIRRYGIYNPWTGQGAIVGLLPHGPHNVRDVVATHVLKMTGSYEQAGFAIQDTPRTVAKHYARFTPDEKSTLIAGILSAPWADAEVASSPAMREL